MFTAQQYRAKAAEFRAFLTNYRVSRTKRGNSAISSRPTRLRQYLGDLQQTKPLKGRIARFLQKSD
jgi:hypothetical protein